MKSRVGGARGAGILPPVKRTAIICAWLASLVAAYLAGRADGPELGAYPPPMAAARDLETDVPEPGRPTAPGLGSQGAGNDLIARAESLVAEGRPYEALAVLDRFFEGTLVEATERYSQALFLLSDEASFCTGMTYDVNGGR